MEHFEIDQKTCTSCAICAEICPARLLEKNRDGMVVFKPDYLYLCLQCGQCMAACHTKSIHAGGLDYQKDLFEFSEPDFFLSMVEHRRSVRRFRPVPVKKDEIEKILHVISQTPHGDSHRHVEITVVNSREKILEILPSVSIFYDKLAKWLRNPLMRRMIQFKKGKSTINTLENHLLPRIQKGIYREISYEYDGITRGAHTLMVFHAPANAQEYVEDAYIYVAYATLAAQNLGIGSAIIGLVAPAINKEPAIKSFFNIPKENEAVVSLILGYPKYKYLRGIKHDIEKLYWL